MSKKKNEAEQETAKEQAAQQEQEAQSDYAEAPQEEQASQEQSKIDYYINVAKQVQADFDNYRKRNANVYADALSDGKAEAIKAFLPVIDNIDRAIASCKEQNAVLEGLKLVRKQADEALKKLGVEEVGAEGEAFDPNLHNAVVQEPAQDGQKSGEITEVLMKGYRIGEKMLRYTMVKVAE